MHLLWKYLRPQRGLIILSIALAAISQVLLLIDPIIFGKIIDDYADNRMGRTPDELTKGVIWWLLIAIAIALLARVAKAFQEYISRLAVQKFGMQIFNDGLKQTLRLSFPEFEEQRSGETMSILQKVRNDTERFFNSFINASKSYPRSTPPKMMVSTLPSARIPARAESGVVEIESS